MLTIFIQWLIRLLFHSSNFFMNDTVVATPWCRRWFLIGSSCRRIRWRGIICKWGRELNKHYCIFGDAKINKKIRNLPPERIKQIMRKTSLSSLELDVCWKLVELTMILEEMYVFFYRKPLSTIFIQIFNRIINAKLDYFHFILYHNFIFHVSTSHCGWLLFYLK